MNTDIFAPYETLYESNTKQYGNINLANSRAKMLEELPQGGGFAKLPFYCYAYDSVFSQATHLNVPSYSEGEAIIRGSIVDYGEWVKHYVSFYPNLVVQNCLGDTDRISNDNYNNNIGAFKPLDIDFTKVRLGMRYNVMNKGSKQSTIVDSTKDLLDNYNTGDYVVIETQCNIMYFVEGGQYTYNSNGTSDISVNFNVGDLWVFGNQPIDYGQHGLQLVPQWWIRLRSYGTEAYSQFHDADTGFLFQGMSIEELKLSTQDEFYDLNNGCLLYRSNLFYDGVEYKPVLTVEQCLKEVAFLALAVCDFENPTNNLYMGYINSDGLATGKLIPYEEWEDSDSLNIVNNVMSDYNEQLDIKPKPTPEPGDDDDIESVGYGYFSNTAMGTLCALKNKLDLAKISQWLLTQTEEIDAAKNIVSIKEIPFPLSTLGLQPFDIPLTIGGHNVTYAGSDLIVGEIVAPTIPTLNIVFADFDIPRLSNTYLDYNPYTKYELLLPFAPSPVTLPDWVIEKNVKAIFLYDMYTTSCQYIVICNNERICAVSGTYGIDRAIAAQNVALRDSARLSAQLGTASSVIGGVISGAVGNINGVASGAIGGISAINQYINAGKQNYMYTIGANSDSSSVGLYHAAHLKITRTLSIEDESYNHTYGRPLCKTRQLSNVSGFTICGNADTSNINTATTAERNAIQQLLTSGVYL